MMKSKDLVSIIITTKNSGEFIEGCLNSIKNQTYKKGEIIVVDNFSSDNTFELAKKFTKKTFQAGPERSAQRNLGAKKALGKFLLFIDSDMDLSRHVVEDCIKTIEADKAVKALVIPEESFGKGFWAQCKKLERAFYVGKEGVDWLEGARFFYKKTFDELKGYDIENTGTEDFDLPQRLRDKYGNSSIKRIKSFIYHNEGELSLLTTLKKKFYYGKGLKIYSQRLHNKTFLKKQGSILQRYKIFFSNPKKLFKNPIIGLGMLFMKTAEFFAGGIGLLSGRYQWLNFPSLGLVLLCLIIFISHTLYILKTFQYPTWDENLYLSNGIFIYKTLHNLSFSSLLQIGDVIRERQPLYSLFIAISLFFTEGLQPYKTALFINVLFYITSIVFVYKLSQRYFENIYALLAAVVFAFYGFPLFYLHFSYTETMTTSFVIGTIYLLSASFKSIKTTIAAALFFAAALLTRWTVPIFFLGAFLCAILLGIYSKNRLRVISNAIIFLIIGGGIPFLIYYIPNYFYLKRYFLANIQNSSAWVSGINYLPRGLQNTFSVHSVMFYFNILSEQTVILFGLFVIGLILCLFFIRKYLLLLLSFAIPYLFFTFLSVFKDDRFVVPIYPIMAIISVVPVTFLRSIRLKTLTIVFIMCLSFLNFLGASWGIGPMGLQGLKDIVLPSFISHPRRIYLTPMVWPPRQNTNAQLFLDTLYKISPSASKPVKFMYIFHDGVLENAMDSLATYDRPDLLRLVQYQKETAMNIDKNDLRGFIEKLSSADYILLKSKHQIEQEEENSDSSYFIRMFYKKIPNIKIDMPLSYKEIAQIFVPTDGSSILIFKREQENQENIWMEKLNSDL